MKQIYWVCDDCGNKYGNKPAIELSTWNDDICDVCGKEKSVTQPVDFGYLKN